MQLQKLVQIVEEVANRRPGKFKIDPDADLVNELGLDSSDVTDLLLLIEEHVELQLDFSILRVEHFKSTRTLLKFVEESLNNRDV